MEPTLLETHPRLIHYLGARGPVMSFVAVAPLLAADGAVVALSARALSLAGVVGAFAVGVLSWTLFEYVVHRWLYHTHFRGRRARWILDTFHLYHHRVLTDDRVLNAGGLFSWPLALLFMLVYLLAFPSLAAAATAHIGLLASYSFYEWVHFSIHHRKHERGYLQFIQRYHLHHHFRRWNANFGNTSPLWDILLRTYDGRYRGFSVTPEVERTFVINKTSWDPQAGPSPEGGSEAPGAASSG